MPRLTSITVIALFLSINAFATSLYFSSNNMDNPKQLDSIVVFYYSEIDLVRFQKFEYKYDNKGDSTLILKYQWEIATNSWKSTERRELTYNETGNKILELVYLKNQENTFDITYKYEYDYDEAGNQILYEKYRWLKDENEWKGLEKQVKSFNSIDYEVLFEEYSWDYDQRNWYLSHRIYREYHPTGLVSEYYEYKIDSKTNALQLIRANEYNYDPKGNILLYIYYINRPEQNYTSQGKSKYEYSYNEEAQIIEKINYSWEVEASNWQISSKYEYQYDDSGNIKTSVSYPKNIYSNELEISSKSDYEYDDSGNKILDVSSKWTAGEWQNRTKTVWNFDSLGNQTLYQRFNWSVQSNIWVDGGKKVWVYNTNNNLVLSEIYTIAGGNLDPYEKYESSFDEYENILFEKFYDSQMGELTPRKKFIYYYSENTTIVDFNKTSEIKLYPNPTNGIINIDGLTAPVDVRIFNTNGQIVKVFQQVNNPIDISTLPIGTYIVNINQNNSTVIKKLVKK